MRKSSQRLKPRMLADECTPRRSSRRQACTTIPCVSAGHCRTHAKFDNFQYLGVDPLEIEGVSLGQARALQLESLDGTTKRHALVLGRHAGVVSVPDLVGLAANIVDEEPA